MDFILRTNKQKNEFRTRFYFFVFLVFFSFKAIFSDVLKVASRYNQIALENLRYFNGASKIKRSDSTITVTLRSPTALRYRVKLKLDYKQMRSLIALRFKC